MEEVKKETVVEIPQDGTTTETIITTVVTKTVTTTTTKSTTTDIKNNDDSNKKKIKKNKLPLLERKGVQIFIQVLTVIALYIFLWSLITLMIWVVNYC